MFHVGFPRGEISVCAFILVSITAGAIARAGTSIGNPAISGTNPSSGHPLFGQTFVVPAAETGISSITLNIRRGATGVDHGAVEIYNWDESATAFDGPALYSGSIDSLAVGDTIITQTPNLAVVPGQSMAIVVNWHTLSPGDAGSYYRTGYYAGGHLLFSDGNTGAPVSFPDYDLAFQMNFGPIPEPTTALFAFAPLLLRRKRSISR